MPAASAADTQVALLVLLAVVCVFCRILPRLVLVALA
jgi:hypothetical protein